MFQLAVRFATIAITVSLFAASASASVFSRGPAGANASLLGSPDPNAPFLTGAGINIGQVEKFRPPKSGLDAPGILNSDVDPVEVYRKNVAITAANTNLADHATQTAVTMVGDLFGVAPDASLYSSAYETDGTDPGYSDALLSIQRIATRPTTGAAHTRAINNSWGKEGTPNGNSLLTLGVDWLASRRDVLLVFGGNEELLGGPVPVPGDNFNGITVAASGLKDGVFREVLDGNIFDEDPDGTRTFVDLLAPGEDIHVTGLGNFPSTEDGTSFAAPHVTGTVALLQEYGDYQSSHVGGVRWNGDNPRHHEVMKAVLLNSADKIAGIHGSKRTIESDGEDEETYIWTDSDAFHDPSLSLDIQLGAGHLNAKRALTQFSSGEWNVGSNVPAIGWDFHETGGTTTTLRYTLPPGLGGYFAVTLAWDRQVTKFTGSESTYAPGDAFTTAFNDLDLYLLPVGWTSFSQAVAASASVDDNVEHIFASVPVGNYQIVVDHFGGAGTDQKYGLAWWHGNPYPTGDFDQDTDVDEDDLGQWESDYGTNGFSDADSDGDSDGEDFLAWQRNFGVGTLAAAATVPEPCAGALATIGLMVVVRRQPRWREAPPTLS